MSLVGKANGQTLVGSLNKCDLLTISAYGIAVKNGYKGTEQEWLLSLQGGAIVDKTLSIDGVAADARATGEAVTRNATAIEEVKNNVANVPALMNEHVVDNTNPHKVTAKQIGLDKVDNTSDKDKPVSTAQSAAIESAKTEALTAANNAQNTADDAAFVIFDHKRNTDNPHNITCDQIGAASLAYADTKTSMTLLWENASPTSDFPGQSLYFDWTPYDRIGVEFQGFYNEGKAELNNNIGAGRNIYYTNAQCRGVTRDFQLVSGGAWAGNSFIENWSSKVLEKDPTVLKPLRVYGIKGVIE